MKRRTSLDSHNAVTRVEDGLGDDDGGVLSATYHATNNGHNQ